MSSIVIFASKLPPALFPSVVGGCTEIFRWNYSTNASSVAYDMHLIILENRLGVKFQ
jgi:hypothetical protein